MLLLDTCAVLFLSMDDSRIRPSTLEALSSSSRLFVSAVTVGELACLVQRGRLELDRHWKPWFREALEVNGWEVMAVTQDVMEEAYSLPDDFHPDPADRMIVASARILRCPVLTTDRRLHAYPHVDAVW